MYRIEWKFSCSSEWVIEPTCKEVKLDYAFGFIDGVKKIREFDFRRKFDFRIVNNKTGEIYDGDNSGQKL